MKKKIVLSLIIAFVLAMSAAVFTACGNKGSDNDNPSAGGLKFERGDKEVSLINYSLYDRYFVGETATIVQETLNFFGGEMDSQEFEVTLPNGSVSKNSQLVFSTVGTYRIKYWIPIYSGSVYAIKEIECVEYNEGTSCLDVVSVKLFDSYCVSNTFVPPKTAVVNYFGKNVTANLLKIVLPDMSESTEDHITLSQLGDYDVVYGVEVKGRNFTAVKRISATTKQFALSGERSEATYKYSEISLKLKEDEEFLVNRIVNLSTLPANEPVISLKFLPQVTGSADAMALHIKFTDVYDENNYVIIRVDKRFPQVEYRSWADPLAYLFAKANGQEYSCKYNGQWGQGQGFSAYCSMVGNPADDELTLYFDYQNSQIINKQGTWPGNNVVTDLDDEEYFGDKAWEGFTTGECYVSIWAEEYMSSNKAMGLSITKLCGLELINSAIGQVQQTAVKHAYLPGSEVSFGNATLSYGGEEFVSSAFEVFDPSGNRIEGNKAVLYTEGTYRIMYYAQKDNYSVVGVHIFDICRPQVGFTAPIFAEYALGAEFTVPQACLWFGDEYPASVTMVAPDNSEYHSGDTVMLNQLGEYTFNLAGNVEGVSASEQYKIAVSEQVSFISGNDVETFSSFVSGYGAVEMLGVRVKGGETATFNKLYTFSSTYSDLLISFGDMAQEDYEGLELTFTFTDALDSTNFFTVTYMGILHGEWVTLNGKLESASYKSPIIMADNKFMGSEWPWDAVVRAFYFNPETGEATILQNITVSVPEFAKMQDSVVTVTSNKNTAFTIINFDGMREW